MIEKNGDEKYVKDKKSKKEQRLNIVDVQNFLEEFLLIFNFDEK